VDLKAELFAAHDALLAAGIECAICGGFAVIVHGHARPTGDIDLLIRRATCRAHCGP